MGKYILAPCVEGELWDIWEFIAKDDPDAATRVVAAAGATFKTLAATPSLGVARKFRNARLRDVLSSPFPAFRTT